MKHRRKTQTEEFTLTQLASSLMHSKLVLATSTYPSNALDRVEMFTIFIMQTMLETTPGPKQENRNTKSLPRHVSKTVLKG